MADYVFDGTSRFVARDVYHAMELMHCRKLKHWNHGGNIVLVEKLTPFPLSTVRCSCGAILRYTFTIGEK